MLRHTHATALLSAGVPVEFVSKRLGHKNSTTTSQTYSNLTHQDIRNAIDMARSND